MFNFVFCLRFLIPHSLCSCFVIPTAAYLNTGIIFESEGNLEEAKHTFQMCASIPDENLKDPHAHKSAVTSCLYNLGKLLHEQGQQEVAATRYYLAKILLRFVVARMENLV